MVSSSDSPDEIRRTDPSSSSPERAVRPRFIPAKRISPSCLHGFSFPSWGQQRILRCLKVSSTSVVGEVGAVGSSLPSDRKEEDDGEDKEELRELRAKLMAHYDVAVSKIQKAASKEEKEKETEDLEVVARPWNLRTRRAACSAPSKENPRLSSSPVRSEERRKFSIHLTKEEIEADLFLMTGVNRKKPKKIRPQKLQRQLDMIFPGMWLSEVSADTYKVPEVRKR